MRRVGLGMLSMLFALNWYKIIPRQITHAVRNVLNIKVYPTQNIFTIDIEYSMSFRAAEIYLVIYRNIMVRPNGQEHRLRVPLRPGDCSDIKSHIYFEFSLL